MRRSLIPALTVLVALSWVGTGGSAVFVGTRGADRLTGTAGTDELYGLAGRDRLFGRAGGDLLDGGAGRDQLSGGSGPDRVVASGDRTADRVRCGPGHDLVNVDLSDDVAADCETISRQLSRDTGTGFEAQHETQVEPAGAAFGSTIVTVFQSGRFTDGGAESIGFAASRSAGRTWRSGRLPGSFERVSDPTIAYDAVHGWWLAVSLASENAVVVNRSRDGLSWRAPVEVTGARADYDKEWATCDNWPSSRFRGRCYVSYMNFSRDTIETRHSTDGGRTWSTTASLDAQRAPAIANGVQVVVRPNGNVLLVFAVFGAEAGNEIAVSRSVDGGATFSPAISAAELDGGELSWLRAPPFPSVDVDAAGTVYVAWRDCRYNDGCTGDIVLARSADGVTWSAPVRIPTEPDDGSLFYFLPALGVDHATSGGGARLALLYHSMGSSPVCDPSYGCLQVDVNLVTSANGGVTWTPPQRLNAIPMATGWMADTGLGRMLGDYVSVSYVNGRPVPVFSLASPPVGDSLRQAIFATTRMR